ncbi:hypothetical protein LshimejAT787_1800570 [Lyophyllum shimeji]|uniref:Uncharacterized protein n=1 Tax=Lyophyllum shimeji TaxID=47721 RepID=A0A9P3PZ84_LYOSH|nr:hypothetical protein LshimejAT787_1800570 [Lyophyllum shimeji]
MIECSTQITATEFNSREPKEDLVGNNRQYIVDSDGNNIVSGYEYKIQFVDGTELGFCPPPLSMPHPPAPYSASAVPSNSGAIIKFSVERKAGLGDYWADFDDNGYLRGIISLGPGRNNYIAKHFCEKDGYFGWYYDIDNNWDKPAPIRALKLPGNRVGLLWNKPSAIPTPGIRCGFDRASNPFIWADDSLFDMPLVCIQIQRF